MKRKQNIILTKPNEGMGQDVEGMGPGERAICLSLFVCLAVAVFTTVGRQLHHMQILIN